MDEPLVAVRIKDGIFVGNATAAHDDDFLMTNKISHVLNCAGSEVKDLFGNVGVKYLTFHWRDAAAAQGLSTHHGVMFDPADANIEDTVRFLDKGMEDGECVLVHDVHGTSRACALVAAYFCIKYGWRVDNALAFMQMAHQEMEIKPHWMRQLRAFAKRHEAEIDVFDPDVDDRRFSLDNDQWMLRNTLLNGLTANIQDGNALYQQCCKEAPPLEPTAKAQQSAAKRRRIVFCDTNQGTHVDSYSSTPVVNAAGATRHRDPMAAAAASAGPSYLGGAGIGAIIEGRRAVVDSIVARRSPINTRRLESAADVNAKGRQRLFRRVANQPHIGGSHVYNGGGPDSAVATPRSGTPIGSGAYGQQHPQQQQQNGYLSQPIHRINSLTGRQEQYAAASAVAADRHAHGHRMAHRDATPTAPHATTPLRTASTIQRHAPSVTAPNTISHSIGNTRPASPMQRRASADPSPAASATTPLRGASAVTPVRQPLKSSTGTVRSPFSVGSGGVTARKGSPLPRAASSGGSPSVASSGYGGSYGVRQGSPTVRREVQSSGYGYGQTATSRSSRPNSPAPQPIASTLGRYGSAAGGGGASPFVQRGAGGMSSRPQSPTQQRLMGSGSGFAPSSAAGSSGVVRRAMSPRPTATGANSSITGGAGSSSIQPSHSLGGSSAAGSQGVRRANSPLTRTRIGGGYQSPYAAGNMSAYSSAAGGGSGTPRQSSPMVQRGAASSSSGAATGVRPSSPARRPTTLAEQYLAGGSSTISRGGATTGAAAPTASSIARRNSPTPVARRY